MDESLQDHLSSYCVKDADGTHVFPSRNALFECFSSLAEQHSFDCSGASMETIFRKVRPRLQTRRRLHDATALLQMVSVAMTGQIMTEFQTRTEVTRLNIITFGMNSAGAVVASDVCGAEAFEGGVFVIL